MSKGNISQEFRLKKIAEVRNYLLQKTNQNVLMSKKHKRVCRVLNNIDHILIVISKITGCVSICAFASLISVPRGITSSATALKIVQ